jgi:hypothetical protein
MKFSAIITVLTLLGAVTMGYLHRYGTAYTVMILGIITALWLYAKEHEP